MRPCNNNSECIYSRENNTFYCRCLNGAPNCDDLVNTDNNRVGSSAEVTNVFETMTTTVETTSIDAKQPQVEPGDAKTVQADNNKGPTDIPKIGFNAENVGLFLKLKVE